MSIKQLWAYNNIQINLLIFLIKKSFTPSFSTINVAKKIIVAAARQGCLAAQVSLMG